MISVTVRINNETILANVQAIRLHPANPKNGEECTYSLRIYNQPCGELKANYGDATALVKQMLDFYDKTEPETIAQLKMYSLLKKEENELKGTSTKNE